MVRTHFLYFTLHEFPVISLMTIIQIFQINQIYEILQIAKLKRSEPGKFVNLPSLQPSVLPRCGTSLLAPALGTQHCWYSSLLSTLAQELHFSKATRIR